MGKDNGVPSDSSELRSLGEERLRPENTAAPPSLTYEESLRLIHELQVRRNELKMQNEELLKARAKREEMEAQLGKYSDLYDFAPAGYFNLDHAGIIRAVNLAGAGLLKVERSLLIGRRLDLFISDETRPVFPAFLDKVFAGESKETCEVVFLKEGFSPVFALVEAVVSESGEVCRAVVLDITGRKLAEEALYKLNEELEKRVAQRTTELRERDQILLLQGRQAALGEMLGNIAHQWRQPLNALGLTIQQLLLFYDAGDFNREFLEKVVGNSMDLIMHMSRTIDDFRNYFKPDKEKVEFKLSAVIADTFSLIDTSFKKQNIAIQFVAMDDPAIFGYRNEFAQVLLNILYNAKDALMERGTADPLVKITIGSEGDHAVVTVADNAGGIADEIMERIFDPYFTTKGPQGGTGVGLFMSKSAIEKNMGGKLVARNIGDGAEFRIEV
jgi:signal transduction histidine kinase